MINSFTVYTRKLFNKFASVTTSQKRRLVVNYTVGVILFVVAVYCLMTRKYIMTVFFGIFSVLFSCSRLISMALINRINAKQLNTYDKYTFYDDKFKVNSFLAGGTPYAEHEHQYSEISSIDFFTTFAYIYLAKGETYIFLRENFKNPEQFDWLMQNLMATANAKKLGISYTMPKLSEYLENSAKDKLATESNAEIAEVENHEATPQAQTPAENKGKTRKTAAKKPVAKSTKTADKKTTAKKTTKTVAKKQTAKKTATKKTEKSAKKSTSKTTKKVAK